MVPLISLLLLSNGAHSQNSTIVFRGNLLVTCQSAVNNNSDYSCFLDCKNYRFKTDINSSCFVNVSEPVKSTTPSKYVWLYGFGSATLLNVASISGIAFSPLVKKSYFPWLLLSMMGVGFGSMTSVSILNLLPVAMDNGDVEMKFPAMILASIFVFYMVDQIMKFWQFDREVACVSAITNDEEDTSSNRRMTSLNELSEDSTKPKIIVPIKSIRDIPAVVYMVFLSDGLHNFVDGLAVGSAFNTDSKNAIALVIAILLEELPCELGDFAIFLKAGLSLRQALVINFICACTNYFGVSVGIMLGDSEIVHRYIYSIAGGMFLYISLSIILVEMVDIQTKITKFAAFKYTGDQMRSVLNMALLKSMLLQSFAIILGFALQLTIFHYAP